MLFIGKGIEAQCYSSHLEMNLSSVVVIGKVNKCRSGIIILKRYVLYSSGKAIGEGNVYVSFSFIVQYIIYNIYVQSGRLGMGKG